MPVAGDDQEQGGLWETLLMAYEFYNLKTRENEHCLAWLIRSGVIDPAAFVEKYRKKATEAYDRRLKRGREKLNDPYREDNIDGETVENMTAAIAELFEEKLGSDYDQWNTILHLSDTSVDPETLLPGLAACAFKNVSCNVVADALFLHVKGMTADNAEHAK